ncbi:hypothetical protein L210DRAFT_3432725 [Boletus edulis BED1]|uniref:Uncharacterized protein n=1 Tax=Boletus edulis BED1 TaxID=1328754 RepID=A0AAD4B9R2_BOLED|nr:hypothetical protein L210DRAFT_3432725 [Boletus edulis BED1]
METSEGRRGTRSLGPDPLVSGGKLSKSTSLRHRGSRSKQDPIQSQSSALSPLKVDPILSDFEPSAFSDEYDLYPKILQDVQRALHLQSRRRERMSQQLHFTSDEMPSSTDTPMNMSASYASTSTAPPVPHSSPQYLQVASLPSEVDFSPSTRSVPPHPVPLSSNGGATLDWTGSHSEDDKLDRRWTISRGKRKAKEKMLPSSKPIVEKQETLFTDRISRIRAEASAPTVRKAAIVSEQLGRRYNILYASLASGGPVGLAEIVRWYAGLGTETRAWLDDAEPLTWLKHLFDRHGKRRSRWHVSALIVEEYIKFKRGTTSSTSLPQSLAASSLLETPPSPSLLKFAAKRTSIPPSDSSPGTSLNQVRSSDGHTSFGPLVANSQDSPGNLETRGEGKYRGWRYSIPTSLDSGSANDTPSPYHRNASDGLSPASSRLNFPNIIHRFRRNPTESEEGSSSPFGSQSEDQNDSAPSGPRRKNRRKDQSRPDQIQSPQETAGEINTLNDIPDMHVTDSLPANSAPAPAFPDREIIVLVEGTYPDVIEPLQCKRSYRSTSLPIAPSVHQMLPESKGDPNERDQLETEYELRLKTLEELRNHNHRLRHRMQRVAVDVREYELVCSSVMPSLGIAYRSLPVELLDALSHDPSAVTSGTRKRQGWRVVEDIHARVLRQREILTSFLSGVKTDTDAVSISENVLDNPISTLVEKLQALESEREPLQEQASEVSRMLVEVRASHSTVKEEYNDALSYTSVVYPELSHIVALEESYRDQYQQVWELGMDALTVILDTITPFWRSYGKIIGEDMQDFIIIPWYRNEFTGESKRYPVKSVPRRSLRHWVALFSFAALTFFITFLQARAAVTSAWHYRLLWIENQTFRWAIIPFFWVVILIQWLALMFEFCVVLLHVSVSAWWLGWFIGICT